MKRAILVTVGGQKFEVSVEMGPSRPRVINVEGKRGAIHAFIYNLTTSQEIGAVVERIPVYYECRTINITDIRIG